MDLVRKLKQLNARKKAGKALPPDEEARRKELKAYLRTTLEAQGGANSLEDSAVREQPQRAASSAPKPVPAASSARKPVPAASSSAPKPMPMPMPEPSTTRAAPRPVS